MGRHAMAIGIVALNQIAALTDLNAFDVPTLLDQQLAVSSRRKCLTTQCLCVHGGLYASFELLDGTNGKS